MKAIVTIGISASGKTTFAKEWAMKNNAIISNRDDLRFSLTGAKDWSQYKFNKHTENLITKIQHETISVAAGQGKNIIVADTNLNKHYRDLLIDVLQRSGYDVEIKEFPITLEEAWKRDALRLNGVGKDVIYKQYQQWLEHTNRRRYIRDVTKPKAIIIDVDGTLAKMGNRGAFEWSKVGIDTVRPIVRQMINSFCRTHQRIIVSGRDGVCYDETLQWLHRNNINFGALLMREEGDMRKDTIIKEEIFWRDIAPHFDVEAVFDDRPSVVRMWHELGIENVIAVADQNVEF